MLSTVCGVPNLAPCAKTLISAHALLDIDCSLFLAERKAAHGILIESRELVLFIFFGGREDMSVKIAQQGWELLS